MLAFVSISPCNVSAAAPDSAWVVIVWLSAVTVPGDARGRSAIAARIADAGDGVADNNLGRVGKCCGVKVRSAGQLQDCDVIGRVGADDRRGVLLAGGNDRHRDARGTLDHVIVGEDLAVGREHHPGAGSLCALVPQDRVDVDDAHLLLAGRCSQGRGRGATQARPAAAQLAAPELAAPELTTAQLTTAELTTARLTAAARITAGITTAGITTARLTVGATPGRGTVRDDRLHLLAGGGIGVHLRGRGDGGAGNGGILGDAEDRAEPDDGGDGERPGHDGNPAALSCRGLRGEAGKSGGGFVNGRRTRGAVVHIHRSGPLGGSYSRRPSQDPDHSVALCARSGKHPQYP